MSPTGGVLDHAEDEGEESGGNVGCEEDRSDEQEEDMAGEHQAEATTVTGSEKDAPQPSVSSGGPGGPASF